MMKHYATKYENSVYVRTRRKDDLPPALAEMVLVRSGIDADLYAHIEIEDQGDHYRHIFHAIEE
jgi:hypothetical protein